MKLVTTINNKLKDTMKFRITLILCSILLIAVREPVFILYPRLWAEEGCIFYQFALHHSLYEIFTTAHVGYLTLFNSIVSAIQAKEFAVENVAIVSTYIGFFVQLIPVYIISFTNNEFWSNPIKKIFCILIVIVVTAPEQWLNTTNSHFIFGLITFLILIISASEISKFQKYFFRILLIIGGLTGPASIFFTPTFLLKAYREKSKEKYIQAGILSVCAVIQAIVIVYSILFDNKYNRLSEHNHLRAVYHFVIDNFSMISQSSTSYFHPITRYLSVFFGALMVIVYTFIMFRNRKNDLYLIPLLSMIIVGLFSTLGSLHMAGGPRYAYVPTCILMMVLLSDLFNLKQRIQYIASLALIICLTLYIIDYRKSMVSVYNSTYPKWKDELKKHEVDSTYNPHIHPAMDQWQVKL
jgi:hypothetical protein